MMAQRVGEKNIMNCGMEATIIKYTNARDIDVQFEDGTVVKGRTYHFFKMGKIANPTLGVNYAANQSRKQNASIVGRTILMHCGMNATAIKDEGKNKITIEFEDGTVVSERSRSDFLRGFISNPNTDKWKNMRKSVLGSQRKMNCGMFATVIEDNGANDITIIFEDGTVVEHIHRQSYLRGEVANPTLGMQYSHVRKAKIVGQHKRMNNGMIATVIEDYGANNVTVLFEDGSVRKSITRQQFRQGTVENENIGKAWIRKNNSIVGQTSIIWGVKATVIEDNGATDITVLFEDGNTAHTTRADFRSGNVFIKSIGDSRVRWNRVQYLGLKKRMLCGMIAEICSYNRSNDISVVFSDGTIVEHKTIYDFLRGQIGNPSLEGVSLPERIVYGVIKKYFPDAIRNYRPNWMCNPETGYNLELDVWIPSKKAGIEYDGAFWHSAVSERARMKQRLITESDNIDQLFTISEKGAEDNPYSKNTILKLGSYSGSQVSSKYYSDLGSAIQRILSLLGIDAMIQLTGTSLSEIIENSSIHVPSSTACVAVKTNARSRRILNVDLNIIYPSLKAAADSVGAKTASNILTCCKGQRKKAYGFRWKFALEPDKCRYNGDD